MHFSPYITALEENAKTSPQKLAFKLPILEGEREIRGWRDITYDQLYRKVSIVAKYWIRSLKLPPGSVVGLWVSGLPFSDFLHILGIMRAGYIPHILNSEVTNLDVAEALFKKTSAPAIIYTASLSKHAKQLSSHFSCHVAIEAEEIPEEDSTDDILSKADATYSFNVNDTVVIIHTSGSTSGRPKLVRLSQGWFQVNARKHQGQKDGILPRMGSFCHVGQLGSSLFYFMSTLCVVLLPWIDYTAEEIIRIHEECNLTAFVQFAPLLSETIRFARTNPRLLEVLQSYPFVSYPGGTLSEADVEWCKKNKIALKAVLASTEVGYMMISTESPTSLSLLNVDGCSYKMLPIDGDDSDETRDRSGSGLLELVVLPDSMDCPDVSLRDPEDGLFHTKDLFKEIRPGIYEYRGRFDDIIKMRNGRNCDTRHIEKEVYAICGDLVSTCVVVGINKPSPALLVEPLNGETVDDRQELLRRIAERITSINEAGYPHERVSPSHILVVAKGEIVRTTFKRSVNRLATEAKFRNQIDALYASESSQSDH